MNVLVICGGSSSERDISLLSGANVVNALKDAGHTVTVFDPHCDTDLDRAIQDVDVVFPILHGTGGEDGTIQKKLEALKVSFVGSGSAVSAACFDKWQTIKTAKHILFPKTELVTSDTLLQSPLVEKPFVIKPRAEGSSVDTFIIRNVEDFVLNDEIANAFNRHKEMMLEELINGQEITVGIVGEEALPVVEIIPPVNQEFDFVNKYNGATIENCPPKFVGEDIQQQAQAIALDLHKTMGCKDFSRTDFIVTPKGKIYTLEINTLPGMTKESLLPRAAKAAGYPMWVIVNRLVQNNL